MKAQNTDLTEGPVALSLLRFAAPLVIGLLLQQLYSTADAWVLGNYVNATALAAVTSTGSMTFLIVGFFNGMALGGSVIISKYAGMKQTENVRKAIHNNLLVGIVSSLLATVLGTCFTPALLRLISTPEEVFPASLTYLRIYFIGISSVIMYNTCMSVMRALGDSLHPLYYLILSSLVNIALDLLLVAAFGLGVGGAAVATVFSQALSCVLCLIRMVRAKDSSRVELRLLKPDRGMILEILKQGLPSGIQNSVISIGNMTVQGNINRFDVLYEGGRGLVIAGQGAYTKVEGIVFLPVSCMSMSLPTFISQNFGAGKMKRTRQGAAFGILCGTVCAELIGILLYFIAPEVLRLFTADATAIRYGTLHARTTTLFYALLAFSHCAAGVLRGLGKSVVPMISMLSFWCGVRVLYVSLIVQVWPAYQAIAWCYPLTWSLSTVLFTVYLLRFDKRVLRTPDRQDPS